MEFTEQISTYYNAESRHAFVNGMFTGIAMLIFATFLWFYSSNYSINKGIAVVLCLGGILASLGGYFAGTNARQSLPEKLELYKTDKQNFFKTETEKVTKIHNDWVRIKVFWTLFLVIGIILIFTSASPFWSGIAIGCLLLGTVGHIEEVQSMKHNEKYYNQILQQATTNKNEKGSR
jgi:hypothetical protein